MEAHTGNLTRIQSNYRKQQGNQSQGGNSKTTGSKAASCFKCGSESHQWGELSEEERKTKCAGYGATCQVCGKTGHLALVCQQANQNKKKEGGSHNAIGFELLTLRTREELKEQGGAARDQQQGRGRGRGRKKDKGGLAHLRYDDRTEQYVPTSPGDTTRVQVEVTVDREQYGKLGGGGTLARARTMNTAAVGDTGASLCCMDPDMLTRWGIKEAELLPTAVPLYAAGKRRLRVRGCLPIRVRTRTVPSGEWVETRDMLYMVDGIKTLYLSRVSRVGFHMLQKWCSCTEITPACCKDGWKVCLVGSRFCSQAEANYEVTAGELLAVVHALNKTKYYTLGSDGLTLCVDHKPLLGILNQAELEKIDNRRLSRLKEKTLCW